jgi:hypothetical protein
MRHAFQGEKKAFRTALHAKAFVQIESAREFPLPYSKASRLTPAHDRPFYQALPFFFCCYAPHIKT